MFVALTSLNLLLLQRVCVYHTQPDSVTWLRLGLSMVLLKSELVADYHGTKFFWQLHSCPWFQCQLWFCPRFSSLCVLPLLFRSKAEQGVHRTQSRAMSKTSSKQSRSQTEQSKAWPPCTVQVLGQLVPLIPRLDCFWPTQNYLIYGLGSVG